MQWRIQERVLCRGYRVQTVPEFPRLLLILIIILIIMLGVQVRFLFREE